MKNRWLLIMKSVWLFRSQTGKLINKHGVIWVWESMLFSLLVKAEWTSTLQYVYNASFTFTLCCGATSQNCQYFLWRNRSHYVNYYNFFYIYLHKYWLSAKTTWQFHSYMVQSDVNCHSEMIIVSCKSDFTVQISFCICKQAVLLVTLNPRNVVAFSCCPLLCIIRVKKIVSQCVYRTLAAIRK